MTVMGLTKTPGPFFFLFMCLWTELSTSSKSPGTKELPYHINHQRNWSYLIGKYHKDSLNYTVKDVQIGCKELRSKKYISDGYCTSVKPITEVVCAGMCLPIADLPFYVEMVQRKSYRNAVAQWKCVNDYVGKERIHLVCNDGTKRSYKVPVVRSCRCRKSRKMHNDL